MPSAHEFFIVTSQYTLEEIFWEDKHTLAALQRRYKDVHMAEPGKVYIKKRPRLDPPGGSFFKPIDKRSV